MQRQYGKWMVLGCLCGFLGFGGEAAAQDEAPCQLTATYMEGSQAHIEYTFTVNCSKDASYIKIDTRPLYFEPDFNDWRNFQLVLSESTETDFDVSGTNQLGPITVNGTLDVPCSLTTSDTVETDVEMQYTARFTDGTRFTSEWLKQGAPSVLSCGL